MRREIILSVAMPVIGSRSAWTRRTEESGIGRDTDSRIGLSGSSVETVFVLISTYISSVLGSESCSYVPVRKKPNIITPDPRRKQEAIIIPYPNF